jgi:hypothetical protein
MGSLLCGIFLTCHQNQGRKGCERLAPRAQAGWMSVGGFDVNPNLIGEALPFPEEPNGSQSRCYSCSC